MFLSDRELKTAIASGALIVDPPPEKIDSNSIDLHLDKLEQAKIWDIESFRKDNEISGHPPTELRLGKFIYRAFASKYQMAPPASPAAPVFCNNRQVIVKPGGFLLWQTKERIGTPDEGAKYICFINSRSTQARTGLAVHMTAPTINASWIGNVTLEIANFGPFDFVLQEGDVIAQIVVAELSSVPENNARKSGSLTLGQRSVSGTN